MSTDPFDKTSLHVFFAEATAVGPIAAFDTDVTACDLQSGFAYRLWTHGGLRRLSGCAAAATHQYEDAFC